jgi:hypothetical protein
MRKQGPESMEPGPSVDETVDPSLGVTVDPSEDVTGPSDDEPSEPSSESAGFEPSSLPGPLPWAPASLSFEPEPHPQPTAAKRSVCPAIRRMRLIFSPSA